MDNLELILENLGLTTRQAKIYLACFKYGPINIAELARKTHQKKSTAFYVVKDLLDKKLLTTTQKGARKLLIAEDPKTIQNMYEDRLETLKKMLPLFDSVNEHKQHKPLVKYYEGRQGVQQIFEDMLNSQEKTEYYWGSIKVIQDVLGARYLRQWVGRRVRRKIKSLALRVRDDEIKEDFNLKQKEYLREIRYVPRQFLVGASLSIHDSKVAFISSQEEGFGFVVESQEFSQMMKNIFMAFWEMSTPAEE